MRVIGVKRSVPFYSLDVIISVGYRVKSQRGTQFRIWANRVLKQYLVKGYAINEKLRKGQIEELRQLVRMLGRTIQKLLSFGSRNFEAGILTDEPSLVGAAADHLDAVWQGRHCKSCKRKEYCGDRIG